MSHKHATVIKAWADGAHIQWRMNDQDFWREFPDNNPSFHPHYQYRIKPEDEFHTVEAYAYYEPKQDVLTMRTVSVYPPNLRMTFDRSGRLVGVDMYERG